MTKNSVENLLIMKKMEDLEREVKSLLKDKQEHCCPITNSPLKNPVLLNDGYIYEREAISKWLKMKKKSPMTNQDIDKIILIPVFQLKSSILKSKESVKKRCISLAKELLTRRVMYRELILKLLKRAIQLSKEENPKKEQDEMEEAYAIYDKVNLLSDMSNLLDEKQKTISQLKEKLKLSEKLIRQLKKKARMLNPAKQYKITGFEKRRKIQFVSKKEIPYFLSQNSGKSVHNNSEERYTEEKAKQKEVSKNEENKESEKSIFDFSDEENEDFDEQTEMEEKPFDQNQIQHFSSPSTNNKFLNW